jgi:hypothetical protein
MRSVVRPALAVVLVVGVGVAGVDLPDRPGPACEQCCGVDAPDDATAAPCAAPPRATTLRVDDRASVAVAGPGTAATPRRAAAVLATAPKTSPPRA